MRKAATKIATLMLIASCCCMPLLAETPAEDLTSKSLESLLLMDVPSVTTASRKSENVLMAASNITVVTAQQIKEWGVKDLKDVLRRVPGFYIGYDRDEWVMAARGNLSGSDNKYLMLIDGHKVNSINNHGPGEMIELPNDLSNVKQIEIIRGPGSAVWGADAFAGVINIITKTPQDLGGKQYNITVVGGTENTTRANFQFGKAYGNDAEIMMMGSFVQSDGKKITTDSSTSNPLPASYIPNSGIANPGSGNVAVNGGRYPTDLDRYRPGYMLQVKGRIGEFSVNTYSFHSRVYHRQYETGYGRDAWFDNDRTFVEGKWNKTVLEDLGLTWTLSTDDIRGEKVSLQGVSSEQLWLDRRVSSTFDAVKPLSSKFNLNAGAEYAYTFTGPDDKMSLNPATLTGASAALQSPMLQDSCLGSYAVLQYNPIDVLSFTGGGRFDYNNDRGSDRTNVNPRLGAIWSASQKTVLKLLYNTGFLRPTAYQAASPTPIAPELMKQVDFIWIQKVGILDVTSTLYWQKLVGNIQNHSNGNSANFYNVGDIESTGAEVEVSGKIANKHTLWANASYCNAKGENWDPLLAPDLKRVTTDGQILNYPGVMANIGGTAHFGKFFISPAVRFVGAINYRDTAALTADLTDAVYKTVDPTAYVDINIGYEPNDTLGFYLYASNMTDITTVQPTSVVNGTYDQYGRYAELKATFKF